MSTGCRPDRFAEVLKLVQPAAVVRCLASWRPQKHFLSSCWPACMLSSAFLPVSQVLFKGPADVAVEEVHAVLRSIVASSINSEDCKSLVQYTGLKRDIVQTAGAALGEVALA